MKTLLLLFSAACLVQYALFPASVTAQVPQLINYQGRVAVGTVNFDGIGQFKFALVNAGGSTTYWSNDGSSVAGNEPAQPVSLTVTKGLYSVLLGDASVAHMTPIPPAVFNNSDVRLRVWFNDGTNGSQLLSPDQRIAAVGYAVIAGNVPDGAITTQKLALSSVTAAQLANGAVGAAQLGAGAVSSANLAAGAAAANLNGSGQSAVGSGGVVLSTDENATALANAGYVKLTSIETAERFRSLRNTPPGRRSQHTAVWTGSEMIIFGGLNNNSVADDGARYDPALDRWTPLSRVNAPSARFAHTAVWHGNSGSMIVWGGATLNNTLADGGSYDVARDAWTPIPVSPVIAARDYHSAVVLGDRMIVWGGTSLVGGGAALNTGGRLDLFTYAWSPTSTGVNAPSARYVHRAIVTATEMIVWGGAANTGATTNTGARYNPTTDTWTAMATPALAGRYAHCLVWTGSKMIAWGGVGALRYNDGAQYDPVANTWAGMPSLNAPAGRYYFSAIWTGAEMIVFGGKDAGDAQLPDGGRFNPATNAWTPLPAPDPYARRWVHTAIWTGTEMIVWGGEYGGGQDTGRRFNPSTGAWVTMQTVRRDEPAVWTGSELLFWGGQVLLGNNSADYTDEGLRWTAATNSWRRIPSDPVMPVRYGHAAVWSGSEMLVWGGSQPGGGRYNPAGAGSWTGIPAEPDIQFHYFGTAVWTGTEMIFWGGSGPNFGDFLSKGGRYNPATGAWTIFNGDPAVPGRISHTAIWTGSEMIVWGGYAYDTGFVFTYRNSGGRYNPVTSQWRPTTGAGAPSARATHSAVWTGREMIVFGGTSNVSTTFADGGRYDPLADSWRSIESQSSISGRSGHSAVWTGSEMVIWGGAGYDAGVYTTGLSNGARYDPAGGGQWFPIAPNHTMGGRSGATAIWTGTEMIVASSQNAATENGNFAEVFTYTPPKRLFLYLRP